MGNIFNQQEPTNQRPFKVNEVVKKKGENKIERKKFFAVEPGITENSPQLFLSLPSLVIAVIADYLTMLEIKGIFLSFLDFLRVKQLPQKQLLF